MTTDTQKLVNKASEAALAATAFANTSARKIVNSIANAGLNPPRDKSSRDRDQMGRGLRSNVEVACVGMGEQFAFLDNMCGPILNNLRSRGREDYDFSEAPRRRGHGGRRPRGSYEDDDTNFTDFTSYDQDNETYDGDEKKRERGERGRDRKSRAMSPNSEVLSYGEGMDDTDTEFSSVYPKGKEKDNHNNKHSRKEDDTHNTTGLDSSKGLSQPLASGFAKRCYFSKSGIGRTTQHYEGLTLTGNTILMLASAMQLKGCPTICDEDLRRVEQTYPNQFSRLPDELLLSSGWRRISKYCHFSHKPVPDGVPFFHSRRRCHPNGGFYFLLCSAVGMTRSMDVEPINRDALAVLQTDFPMPCEQAPKSLVEDPDEWTLVNKFCFFSGGPINVEEDVYYRAELGGTEIYMLAFLSPSLSPEELYRLKPSTSGKPEDSSPLETVAAVEEIETVYDLTETDFDELKLYHLGPCRALPPHLLHPEAWTKVLPPNFIAAKDQAMSKVMHQKLPKSTQPAPHVSGGPHDSATVTVGSSEYVELGGGSRNTPASGALGMTQGMGPPTMGPPTMGPTFSPHYGGMPPMMHPPQHPMQPPAGAMPYQQQAMNYGAMVDPNGDVNYYYGNAGPHIPPGPSYMSQQHVSQSPNPYGNSSFNQSGFSNHTYGTTPPRNNIPNPRWGGNQNEGAFGMNPIISNDQPDDEAFATRGGSSMYNGDMMPNNGMMPNHEMNAGAFHYNSAKMETALEDAPPKNPLTSNRQEDYKRPDLSTKLGNQVPVDGWDTRTDGDSTYASSAVTGSSFTDAASPSERNARRALILQMAKARLKNGKQDNPSDKADVDEAEDSNTLADQAAQLELD